MAAIAKLKQEIQFNGRLAGLLDALKSIAAQQYQSLERKFRANEKLFEAARLIVGTFDVEHLTHPFTQTDGPVGVIAVTSDTGLLGGLNQQVVATAVREYRRSPGELMVIGERGLAYVREAGLSCQAFGGIQDTGRATLAARVRDYALGQVMRGRLAALNIVYARALSFTMQRIELVRVLPLGAWFKSGDVPRGVRGGPVLLESPVAGVLEYAVWLWLLSKLMEVFALSRLAELAARSVHLEGSSQELQRRGKKLQLRYFRERHELIDRGMRELSAAKAIFSKSLEEP